MHSFPAICSKQKLLISSLEGPWKHVHTLVTICVIDSPRTHKSHKCSLPPGLLASYTTTCKQTRTTPVWRLLKTFPFLFPFFNLAAFYAPGLKNVSRRQRPPSMRMDLYISLHQAFEEADSLCSKPKACASGKVRCLPALDY